MEFLTQLAKQGQAVPALQNRPKLLPECQRYWDSFIALDGCRTGNGRGPNPIQVSEILAYTKLSEVEGEEAAKLFRIIRRMDASALDYYTEQASKG